MKKLVMVAQLIIFAGHCVSQEWKYTTFDEYFLEQERRVLDTKLAELETESLEHETYALGINADNFNWVQCFYNVSKISLSLIRDLQPSLTIDEAVQIGKTINWAARPTRDIAMNDTNLNWEFQFELKYLTNNEPARNWRLLTNLILLWKSRLEEFKASPNARLVRSVKVDEAIVSAKNNILNSEKNMLQEEFGELWKRSFKFNSINDWWIDVVFDAAMISDHLLKDYFVTMTLSHVMERLKLLGWYFDYVYENQYKNRDPTKPYIWDYAIVVKPAETKFLEFDKLFETDKQKVKEILQAWATFTNKVIQWKLQNFAE